jgi:hypothetical protein
VGTALSDVQFGHAGFHVSLLFKVECHVGDTEWVPDVLFHILRKGHSVDSCDQHTRYLWAS